MRVGLIASPWISVPPTGYGGTELVVDLLARGLVQRGHEVVLCTTGDSSCPVERWWIYERCRGTSGLGVAAELRHTIEAYAALDGRVDLVHDHTVAGPLVGARTTSLPIVTTNHGPFDHERRTIDRSLAGRVTVVAISHQQAAGALTPPHAVIHHGLDTRTVPVGDGAGGYVLFLGRMTPEKGARDAVLVAREAGVPLLLAAKIWEREERIYFDEQVAPLLGGDITYVGEAAGDRKWELLAGAEALVNPLQWDEPFGLVMIEALAAGTPVVATSCGAAPEIVDHGRTGFLFGDLGEMAAALDKRDQLERSACRSAAETRFSSERMVDEHVALYEAVLSGRRP